MQALVFSINANNEIHMIYICLFQSTLLELEVPPVCRAGPFADDVSLLSQTERPRFPRLSLMARDYLAFPATTTRVLHRGESDLGQSEQARVEDGSGVDVPAVVVLGAARRGAGRYGKVACINKCICQ
jgi:hypothetical protein